MPATASETTIAIAAVRRAADMGTPWVVRSCTIGTRQARGGSRGQRALTRVTIARVSWWRHARAIVLLPGVVTILVPWLLLAGEDGPQWDALALAGAALIAAGVAVWAWTVR